MNLIYRCEFGSAIYGTSVPTSDKDYKSIFLPEARDILLQKAPRVITKNTKLDERAKNTQDDIDDEAFSLQEYLKLLLEGQTPALDMLYCPKELIIQDSEIMQEIRKNKDKFLHKGVSQFVGYVKTQANKYGIKGSRMGELKKTIEHLYTVKKYDSNARNLSDLIGMHEFMKDKEHVSFVKIFDTAKKEDIFALEVCNRKFPLNLKIDYVLENLEKIYESYGHRAEMASKNEGVDWKALYHAVRVSREAEELLLTGNITFPRPEKDLLLQIRKGELPYKQVAELIEEGLVRVEAATLKSSLPDAPDYKWAEKFVLENHLNIIIDPYEQEKSKIIQKGFEEIFFDKTKKHGW